jgi:hypothetical protein
MATASQAKIGVMMCSAGGVEMVMELSYLLT